MTGSKTLHEHQYLSVCLCFAAGSDCAAAVSELVASKQRISCYVHSCNVHSCYVHSCNVHSCNVHSCNVHSCNVHSCNVHPNAYQLSHIGSNSAFSWLGACPAHRSANAVSKQSIGSGRWLRMLVQVAGACLYIFCRQEQKPFMLIDISDVLQINVFALGAVFLQMCHILHLENQPMFFRYAALPRGM